MKCLFCNEPHDNHAAGCEQIREAVLLLSGGTLQGVLALLRPSASRQRKKRRGGVRYASRAKALRRQGMTWADVSKTLGGEGYVSSRGRPPSPSACHAAVNGPSGQGAGEGEGEQ